MIVLLGEARERHRRNRKVQASWKAIRKSGEGVGDWTVILTVRSERAE